MVGSAFNQVSTNHELCLVGRSDADLLDYNSFLSLLKRVDPQGVIHLAAKVGGVKGNSDYVADFYHQNTVMNVNVLNACHNAGIEKVVSLLSTCVYPDNVNYPLTEEQIHNGPPHISNFGYAYAKRMLDVHSRALRSQYDRNYVCAVPNNLYGPHDNFDLENGHVIPAIIRKVWEAKMYGETPVFWGDGTPLREFTYSKDIAGCLLYILDMYNEKEPINIGMTSEVSIKSLVTLICDKLGYDGPVEWDTSKPSGQFKKPSSNQRFLQAGWNKSDYTPLEEGIEMTCNWFKGAYPNVRGLNL